MRFIINLKCRINNISLQNIIGPQYNHHWLPLSLTPSLTHSCLVDLIDVTLACDDANSKVVTVADVDAEKRVDGSFVQIWKLEFDHKVKVLFRL